jgi:nicotinate-nucleotide adenylyltransferase
VWWLVSPQNPLKPQQGMAPFAERVAGARAMARRHRAIRVSTIEDRLGTRYTADTLAQLHRRFPRLVFVWLMGADNLIQVAHWERWQEIFNTTPVAVFARPTYSSPAVVAKAAHRFAGARLPESAAGVLAERQPPAWVFIHGPLLPVSATAIRERRRDGARAGTAAASRSDPERSATAPIKERTTP